VILNIFKVGIAPGVATGASRDCSTVGGRAQRHSGGGSEAIGRGNGRYGGTNELLPPSRSRGIVFRAETTAVDVYGRWGGA